jgi:putative membrane-bound dehydrogenase-like protein
MPVTLSAITLAVFGLSGTFASLRAAEIKLADHTFTVPDGFEVELICGPPLVQRPISAAFDEEGRVYVTDSSGSNDKPEKQLQEKPHRIMRLEDTKGNGHFDKATVFADKMMFPEGCMWYDGSVYVAAPPSIWKLTDTNNDGVADVREEWHQGKTLTGCANDLHGPYLGPDGWIYWCKGAFAQQSYDLPNGKPFTSRAAHIFRARPDHSGLEPVMTGGMDNPVGLAWTAEGERILCGTFFDLSAPGRRDGLIHAVYGGVYGKVNEVTDEHKKTGDLMPVMTQMGPAAPCAVIRYESRVFGKEYQDNLFVCCFNYHKVTRHILEPDGATFKTKDSDFLVSDNLDFHPTDVIEDADGSLIVIDTGGWYKICCPTSQLSKPDVLGAIYRVRRVGAPKVEDPRGLKIQWGRLSPRDTADLFRDERPAVRKRAISALASKGLPAVAVLDTILESGSDSPELKPKHVGNRMEWLRQREKLMEQRLASSPYKKDTREGAVWALTRIELPQARLATIVALHDLETGVRLAAYASISLHRDQTGAEVARSILNEATTASEWRIAFEALGRTAKFPRDANVFFRLNFDCNTLRLDRDRVLQHSLTYSMMESEQPEPARSLVQSGADFAPSGLIALDEMDKTMKSAELTPFLGSQVRSVRKAAMWVLGRHPEWGSGMVEFFRGRIGQLSFYGTNLSQLQVSGVNIADTEEERAELKHQLAEFSANPDIQRLMRSCLQDSDATRSKRILVLEAMAEARLKQYPADWVNALRLCLGAKDPTVVRAGITAAGVFSQAKTNTPDFSEALLSIGRFETHPADLRLDALAALPNGLRKVDADLFSFLCTNVDSSKPVATRSAAASVLAKARLSQEQLSALADAVKLAGPLEVTKLLGAFEHSTNEAVGLKLFGALKESKALASLRPDLLKTLAAKYPASVQEKASDLMTLLNVDAAKQSAHLQELIEECKDGDIRRGQAVFNSPIAACSTCHTLGYMGGKVGPDLTSIGQARSERDLLESIVYPSASFVRSYEPMIVKTKSEEEYTGILKKDAPDEVVLVTGPNAEARIARSDIVEMRPGTVSIMPAGLDQQLSKQELADLLAFLKATKWGPR